MPGKGDNVVAGVVEGVFYQESVVKNRLVQKGAFVQRGSNNGDKGDIVKESNFIKEGTVVGGFRTSRCRGHSRICKGYGPEGKLF